MSKKSLLIFDFDGVIIDGMNEYWNSSRQACLNILKDANNTNIPNKIPKAFKYLRPWVQHGWEMVLITAELIRPESYLISEGFKKFSDDYKQRCKEALEFWQWSPSYLQEELDNVRRKEIKSNLHNWINSHQSFPGIPKRINKLQKEGNDIVILTTKGAEFTERLLDSLNINFNLLYGHESGKKIDILMQLSQHHTIQGFIEDRRKTLEKVINTSELISIPCFLASWGYLKPTDSQNLPSGICLLEPQTFANPLANWN